MINIDGITNWIKNYFAIDGNGPNCKAVIGISGGKDSTIAAALLVRALGPDRVVAVKMPQGNQHRDGMDDEVINYLGITEVYEVDIGPACEATLHALPSEMRALPQVYINIPARERMKVLYAIASAVHGRVANTSNRSEIYVGYSTKFGDGAGDFAILAHYTVRDVLKIGQALGLPEHFIHKVPEDGLSGKTDEENLGFSYQTLDSYILDDVYPDFDTFINISTRHEKSRHKRAHMPVCSKSTIVKTQDCF